MSTIKVDNIDAKTGAGDITLAAALSGAATKFKISGGSANYILQTDGSAGLSWIANDQGDITGVTAGNGITVAAPTGPVPTVTVGQGTGITVNTNDVEVTSYANLANRTADAAWTGSQRATLVTDNDGSFDLNLGQNFFCTPAAAVTLTFTNHVSGQSGYILLDNAAYHKSPYILKMFDSLKIPIIFSGAHSYDAAPCELYFAAFKKADINPRRVPTGKR